MLADYAYGGEVVPGPLVFLGGSYLYDDDSGTATVTPFQNLRSNFTSLLAEMSAATRGSPGNPALWANRPQWVKRRSEEHTSELQSHLNLVCRLLLEKKKKKLKSRDRSPRSRSRT